VSEFSGAFATALSLIVGFDAALVEIVGLSLRVSFSAVTAAAVIGLPLGAAVALFRFPGRGVVSAGLNALMGLPPVVVGLVVYLMLSRIGPFGVLGLLFTPTAMIIAQCVLITPILAALTRQVIEDLWEEYEEQLRSLGAGRVEPETLEGTALEGDPLLGRVPVLLQAFSSDALFATAQLCRYGDTEAGGAVTATVEVDSIGERIFGVSTQLSFVRKHGLHCQAIDQALPELPPGRYDLTVRTRSPSVPEIVKRTSFVVVLEPPQVRADR